MATVTLLRVIILDKDPSERRRLVGLLSQTQFNFAVIEAESEQSAVEHLNREEIALFFIGSGYPHLSQQEILLRHARTKVGSRCAFIVVSQYCSREEIGSLINAGASGILLAPLAIETIDDTIETAISLVREQNISETDQVNSLPWILEGIARRLESIAHSIKETASDPIPASTRQMQEALLLAFSGQTDLSAEGADSVVRRHLIASGRH
jgi:DNA-binding NarL/FixJ family response regulator